MEAEYHFIPDFKQITAFKMVEVEWGVGIGGGDWGWGLGTGIGGGYQGGRGGLLNKNQ